MKRTFIKRGLLTTILATLYAVASSFGQTTITTGTLNPTAVCVGGNVSVPFTTTGIVAPLTNFIAQLSDAAGAFGASPMEIGNAADSPITATIPTGTAAGAAYKIRVVSVLTLVPVATGSESAALTVNAIPGAPVVISPVPYVQGATAVPLGATGTGLLWYAASSGGAGDATAPTPPTTTIGTISYFVSQTVSGCESARAQIDVTVSAAPCVPPAAPGVADKTYTVGDASSPLTATGTNLLWYTAATGGVGNATAPTPSTASAGTTSYWVTQSATAGSCESPRAKIDVIVNAPACVPPAAPGVADKTYTVGDASAPLTATGTNLLWYNAATGGVGNATAPTPSTASAGTTSYWVTQSATAGSCESARAKIDVIVNAAACVPPAAPGVANKTYTVGDASAPLTASGTNLLWYSAASGGVGSSTAPTPSTATAGTTSYWVTQSATAGSCESPRAKIDVIVNAAACVPPAAPTVANVSYTVGATAAQLTAGGTNLLWYSAATGGVGNGTAPTPSTASAGTTSYWVTQAAAPGSCESARSKIDVVVSNCTPPAAPTVTTPVNYTIGQTATPLSATGSGNFLWYTTSTGGVGNTTAPTPSTASAGTTSYWVSQVVASCESARSKIDVVVNACTPPTSPTVTSPVSYVVGQTPAQLTASGPGTKLWYTVSTGGVGNATAPTPSTSTPGTTSYYVTQTVSGCESARSKIDVVVSACTPPVIPGVSNVSYCIGTPAAQLTASGAGTKVWYTVSSGGTGTSTAPTPNTSAAGTTSYYVSQIVGGCESARAKIDVTVNQTPAPGLNPSSIDYCLNASAAPLSAIGTSLKWYTVASGGTGSATAITPSTNATGTKSYYVTQTLNGCESARSEIKVNVKNVSAAPTVGAATLSYCQNVLVSPLTATGNSLQWYSTATGGSPLGSAPVPGTATTGTTSYYVSQTTAGFCEGPRTKIDVIVNATPVAPTVSSAEYCVANRSVTLAPAGTAFKWYAAPSGGTGTTAAPNVSLATAGNSSYYVTQTTFYGALGCESPRAKLDITINALPASLTPLSDALCQERGDKTYTFSASPAGGNSINWYASASTPTKEGSTPSINLKNAGETTYFMTQVTGKGCESAARVSNKIRVKPLPALPAVTTTPIVYCQFIPAVPLSATAQANATLNWFGTDPSGGNSSDAAPTPSTENGGTTSFYVAQTLEGCLGDRAKIDVQVNTTELPTVATPSLAFCQGETAATLSAEGNSLKWYLTINDTNPRTSPLTPFTEKVQDYSFYVTQTGAVNGCESPKAEIKIHIKALPSATISGNSTVDLGQSATITLKFTGDGPWKYVLSNGLTDSTDQATKNVTVTPSTTTTYVVTQVSNSCGKGTPIGSAVVSVRVPTITSGNPTVSEACAGKSFGVPFQQSGDFPAGNTFKVQISLTNEDAGFYTIPSVATSNMITATFPDTTSGGNYFIRVVSAGTNPDFLVRGSVSAVGIDASPLPVATVTGTQTILIGDSGDLKVEFTGKSPWSFNLNNGTTDSLITANATPYTFRVSPRVTTTYTISSVSNSCGNGKGAGSARVQVDPILGIEPPVTDWVKVYPTVIEAQQCTVELTGSVSSKEANVQLFDMSGRVIHNQQIFQKTTGVDFAKYPSGLYLLKVQNGNLNSVHRIMKP